ncbi:uncharacterized protein LOC131300577 [Rhododendron vialii]|uniref:uncharacterized protein LOC131300577 n=1 Tax=Rhododendron vialii TaxID=182163 RepID=UPI00265EF9B9|nr:uncharacterized protein LOC131300577 [Rhododendron vialii]
MQKMPLLYPQFLLKQRKREKGKMALVAEPRVRKRSLKAISTGLVQNASKNIISERPKSKATYVRILAPIEEPQYEKLADLFSVKQSKKAKRTKIVDAFVEEEEDTSKSSKVQKASLSTGKDDTTDKEIELFEFGDTTASNPSLQSIEESVCTPSNQVPINACLGRDNVLLELVHEMPIASESNQVPNSIGLDQNSTLLALLSQVDKVTNMGIAPQMPNQEDIGRGLNLYFFVSLW